MKYNKSVTKLVLFGIVVVIDFRGGKHCYRCCDAYNIQPRIVLSNKNSNVIINDHHVVASWLTCIPSSSSYLSRRLQMSPSPYSDEGGYGGSTTENEWSTTDDWNRLSDENPQNSAVDSRTLLDQDIIRTVANLLADESIGLNKKPKSSEEKWVDDTISHIYHVEESCCKNDLIISDDESETIFENNDEDLEFEEDMSREIAMLVRCNESPETMLIEQGRAIPELTPEQLNDVSQLIQSDDSNHIEENQPHQWIATTFLQQAVHFMFEQHGSTMQINGDPETTKIMDAVGIASWMQTSLKEAADATTTTKYEAKQRQQLIGRHDSRVVETIAKYGSYGKNYLTEPEFVQFYVSAIVGTSDSNHRHLSTMEQVQKYRQEEIKNVWRDIRNHGIVSPIELQRTMQLAELKEKLGLSLNDGDTSLKNSLMILDECELVYDDQINNGGTSRTSDRQGRSSHELVQTVSPTSKVPLYMKDGDFVFIDEETCIGCMQCVTAAPASFKMLENGRARAFFQRSAKDVKAAVNACPAAECMHFVSYDELTELETARDVGVGDDHRHFGHTETRGYIPRVPLHVSRRDSDANHRESFYHFVQNQCFKSSKCPQRGCYDCPRYKSDPDSNPYFQEKIKKSDHLRAQYFVQTGLADPYRKAADL